MGRHRELGLIDAAVAAALGHERAFLGVIVGDTGVGKSRLVREAAERLAKMESWTDEHYHQPTDELEDWWNFEGMVEDAKLGFYAGLIAASQDDMPSWTPGDEFEAAREEALAAVEGGE